MFEAFTTISSIAMRQAMTVLQEDAVWIKAYIEKPQLFCNQKELSFITDEFGVKGSCKLRTNGNEESGIPVICLQGGKKNIYKKLQMKAVSVIKI